MNRGRFLAVFMAATMIVGFGVSSASAAGLRSPSGAIKCEYQSSEDYHGRTIALVRCDVTGVNDTAWVVQRTGRGKRVRVTDAVVGGPVLGYGKSRNMGGGFRCTSRRTGVTCLYRPTGHGFTVSKAASRRRTF